MDVYVDFGSSIITKKSYKGFIVTDKAAVKITEKTKDRPGKDCIKLKVVGSGCNGFAYVLEFVGEIDTSDLFFENNNINIWVDPKSIEYIDGTTLDYETKDFSEGFIFKNPNEKASCGCGESFSI